MNTTQNQGVYNPDAERKISNYSINPGAVFNAFVSFGFGKEALDISENREGVRYYKLGHFIALVDSIYHIGRQQSLISPEYLTALEEIGKFLKRIQTETLDYTSDKIRRARTLDRHLTNVIIPFEHTRINERANSKGEQK